MSQEKDLEPATPGEAPDGAFALSPQLIAAMTQHLYECSRKSEKMLDVMRRHGFVIDNLEDRWQKLAFTLYSEIVEISHLSRELLDNYEAEVNPEPAMAEGSRLAEPNTTGNTEVTGESNPQGPG